MSGSFSSSPLTRRSVLTAGAAIGALAAIPGSASASTGDRAPAIPGVRYRHVEVDGLRFRLAEAGSGPLVLLLHGFPQTSYAWRHQLVALARAGFHAVAPDQRGYPGSAAPSSVLDYSIHHLASDAVGIINALGAKNAVLVGHDWGVAVAQAVALNRPDLVRGLAALSVPLEPRGDGPPMAELRAAFGDNFYQLYFLKPGAAEREFERRTEDVLRKALFHLSGDAPQVSDLIVDSRGLTGSLPLPRRLPRWLTDKDIQVYADSFARSGFTGPLNWYRNRDRNWGQTGSWAGARITQPVLYIGGDRDPVAYLYGLENLRGVVQAVATDVRSFTVMPGVGHWIPEERPAEVSAALTTFAAAVS
ncbi:alpha/beta fold hydrolase [Actinoplanes sp. M2I2]|uniref:alpha/beta fold hydrolase n=1 Tax=Actinoplanes sp. M2I2 TaxID=1734444 RepID=UPI002020BA1D|nr:alpha/beta hydrolase [Actinoplanes sp. M2I2]